MKKSELRALIREVIDEEVKEGYALGSSHGNVGDNPENNKMVRDPLNDPLLTGKLDEISYRFTDFNWLANISGFDKPIDVYYGSILLGVIVSEPDGYVIERIMGPLDTVPVKKTPNNKFKTKNDAAKVLHRVWKRLRLRKMNEGDEWRDSDDDEYRPGDRYDQPDQPVIGKRNLSNPNPNVHKELSFRDFLFFIKMKKLMPYYVIRIFEWGNRRITFSLIPYNRRNYPNPNKMGYPNPANFPPVPFGKEFLEALTNDAVHWFEAHGDDRPDYFDLMIYGIDKNNNILFGIAPQEGF